MLNGAVIVRADPSRHVDEQTAVLHRGRGVAVRDLLGATNSVWYGHFDPLVAAVPEVFEWSIVAALRGVDVVNSSAHYRPPAFASWSVRIRRYRGRETRRGRE